LSLNGLNKGKMKNTSLQSLNLSGNEFSSAMIDDILGQLENVSSDKGLALIHLTENTLALNDHQQRQLVDKISRSFRTMFAQHLDAEKPAKQADELDLVTSSKLELSYRDAI
jgi:hypothetical protein